MIRYAKILKRKILLLSLFLVTNSSLFSQCFEIESILVDACGSPEGENEMVRFKVGNTSLNTADMTVNWPNNSWLGICQNATTTSAVSSLNATIQSCGLLIEPTGGILPANAQVLLVTSTAIDVTANSFANLSDTIYIIFQCVGNTAGHFANWSTPSGLRTLTINFSSPIGCIDQVTYDKVLLVNQTGGIGGSAAIRDGALANFDAFGSVTYENFGCQAPFTPSSISISALTTVNVCPGNSIQVFATTIGSISSLNWQGNNGTFNTLTNDTVIYTLSLNDTTNFYIVVEGTASCGTIKDSILISINPPVSSTDVQTACNSYTWIDGITYTVSTNTPKDTLVAANGCDSVVTLNLTINNSTTATDIQAVCNSYIWIDGNVYTSSTNTPKDTLVAANGCDSIVTLNLTINTFVSSTDIQTACNSYTWIDGITYIASTNTPTDTLVAANDCDSVVTLNLTINPTATSTDVQTACNSLTWVDGINYTANTNTPTFAMVGGSSTGCDSVVTLNLTINQPVLFNQSFNECQGFSVAIGSNTYNSTGSFIDTLVTVNGCDSIVTTNLIINSVQQVAILEKDTTICENESLVLHAIGTNLYWSNGENTDSIIVSTQGVYTVTTLNACPISASITIFQKSCVVTSIFIPNVFTPNGDNQNDFFIVEGVNITSIEGVIFNRWGQQLFTWNDINMGWDGTYKNKIVPDGTYFYMIKAEFLDDTKRNLQGSITLLR